LLDLRHRGLHIQRMTDPFLLPEDPTAADAVQNIGEELAMFDDWMDRYQFIIELGRKLPPYPAAWQDEAHQVKGCQSQVWLAETLEDDRLFFAGASDAAIVSGLVALVLRVYSGRTRDEILGTSPQFLKDLGLIAALSTNRGNGVAAMVERIHHIAHIAGS
jgi:cysteine desulfuration protein SufE